MNRIIQFFKLHNVLYPLQYGFRQGCSTTSAVVELVDYVIKQIEAKKIVGGLFIDLKKAFDTLNHNILLKKLEYCGVRGLPNRLIGSYLTNRKQFVAVEGKTSKTLGINTGVPQGSNIGPLLFLVYINDIGKLDLKGIPRLFADDSALFYPGASTDEIVSHVEHDLCILNDYFCMNLLSLNLAKTKYMLFHSPRKKPVPRNHRESSDV